MTDLNQHPLNQAALRRLRAEGEAAPEGDDLAVLDLALLGLDRAGLAEDDPAVLNVVNSQANRKAQGLALKLLEAELEPAALEADKLETLGEVVSGILQQAPQQGWEPPPQEA
jgi:hypothetical protein